MILPAGFIGLIVLFSSQNKHKKNSDNLTDSERLRRNNIIYLLNYINFYYQKQSWDSFEDYKNCEDNN